MKVPKALSQQMKIPGTVNGFKEFILRGNVVELAVGIVIGAAFSDIISSFVDNLLTPFIAVIGGQPNFSELILTVNGVDFNYGLFLNSLIQFLIVATVIYFLVIIPMNHLIRLVKTEESPDPTSKKCDFCFTEIPVKAHRCPNCTSELQKGKVTT